MSTSTSSSSDPPVEVLPIDTAEFRGERSGNFAVDDLQDLLRLVDPTVATRTIHWGRNYLYEAQLATSAGMVPVVVKVFTSRGLRESLSRRRKGSKALRSWRASLAMLEAGVPVPEPIALLESIDPDGPSYFVSALVEGVLEARYLFRAMTARRERELYPDIRVDLFLETLGRLLRRLHEADLWHRDVSVGNILLREDGSIEGGGLFLLDLNRTRIGTALSRSERMRDLSRLPLARPEHRRQLMEGYFGSSPGGLDRALFLLYHHGFIAKNRLKEPIRGLRKWLRGLRTRSAHVYIPAPDDGTQGRDRVAWDPLSDQPHLHAGRMSKLRVRLGDGGVHLRELGVLVRGLPPIHRRYRELKEGLYRSPIAWGEMGVGIHGGSASPRQLVEELEALGSRHVLLRLHLWEDQLARDEELAKELHRRGFDVALAVPQNRQLVKDSEQWRSGLMEVAERFAGVVTHIQAGHAINRSKWGIWNQREYSLLIAQARDALSSMPGVKLMGPAVIDFEFHQTLVALNWPEREAPLDVVSSLLYVDRRGAPERGQAGLDTVDKVVLLRALIQVSREGERPSWITEVNWPLREGPHSPAGRHVAVDEERQADYLVRFYLLALGTGLVERIYWWQLVARGYGLAHGGGDLLKRRPAFAALSFMHEVLEGSRFLGPLPSPLPVRLYSFGSRDGVAWVVAWRESDDQGNWRPPVTPRRVLGRDGDEIAATGSSELTLSGSPTYLELEDQDWEAWSSPR